MVIALAGNKTGETLNKTYTHRERERERQRDRERETGNKTDETL